MHSMDHFKITDQYLHVHTDRKQCTLPLCVFVQYFSLKRTHLVESSCVDDFSLCTYYTKTHTLNINNGKAIYNKSKFLHSTTFDQNEIKICCPTSLTLNYTFKCQLLIPPNY